MITESFLEWYVFISTLKGTKLGYMKEGGGDSSHISVTRAIVPWCVVDIPNLAVAPLGQEPRHFHLCISRNQFRGYLSIG
jgi:hypothetical protein